MTQDDLRSLILEEIGNIAPEAELAGLQDEDDLRDALDLDSMDIFNLVAALHMRLEADIPEAEVPRLVTLGGAIDYLREKMGHGPASTDISPAG